MTRRLHRGLLLGISLVALVAGGASAQDLTNPAGTTIGPGLIRVDTGDTFDNVFNFGTIAGDAATGSGIEVTNQGQVVDDVQNGATGIIALTGVNGIGLRVEGWNVSIGGNVENFGLIRIDARAGQAYGLLVGGTGTVGGDVANGDDASILVAVSNWASWYGGGFDVTLSGVSARGMSVPANVTGIDDIVNEGVIAVTAVASLNIVASDSMFASAAAAITHRVYAVGIEATGAPIEGALINEGRLDVRALAHTSGQAHATGASAHVEIGSRNANLSATAVGIDSDLDSLPGGLHNSGRLDVAATAESIYEGAAHATSGDASAYAVGSAFDRRVSANASGIHADLETATMGSVTNDGRIDVAAIARNQLHLSADADDGNARARLATGPGGFDQSAVAFARGFYLTNFVSGDTIAEGVTIDRRVDVTAAAVIDLEIDAAAAGSATASLAETGGGTAKLFAQANVRGVNVEFVSLIDGDFDNDARIDVEADGSVSLMLTAEADTGHARALVDAPATFLSIGAQISATGLRFVVSTLNGDFINTGDIDAVGHGAVVVALSAYAHDGDATASIEALSPRIGGVAELYGIVAFPGLVVQDFRVEGDIEVTAEAVATVELEARAQGGNALAYIAASGSLLGIGPVVSATGLFGIFGGGSTSSIGGDFIHSGDIDLEALAVANVALVAEAADGTADAHLVAAGAIGVAASVSARGVGMEIGRIGGSIDNSGDVTIAVGAGVLLSLSADGGLGARATMQAARITVLAACGFCSGPAPIIGIDLEMYDLAGDFINSGDVGVAASGLVAMSLAAHAESGTAYAAMIASGSSIVVSAPAFAIGLRIGMDEVHGDFTNSGDIDVAAAGVVLAGLTAVADDGPARAVMIARSSYVVLAAEATATGIVLDGRSVYTLALDGDFGNSGDIAVTAAGAVSASMRAEAGSGQAFVILSAVSFGLFAEAHAVGIDLQATTIGGGVANSGDITALALAGAAFGQSALADGDATAALQVREVLTAHATAAATGLRLATASIVDDLDNSGDITVGALATLTIALAADGGSAYAALGVGAITMNLSARAQARGVLASATAATGAFGEDVLNSGDIDAAAHGALVIALSATAADGDAFARIVPDLAPGSLHATAIASAIGFHLLQGDIVGDVDSSGAIDAAASAYLSIHALADSDGGRALALISNQTQYFQASAFAFGLELTSLGTVGGAVTNSGDIDVAAVALLDFGITAYADGAFATAAVRGGDAMRVRATASATGFHVAVGDIAEGVANSGAVDAVAIAGVRFAAHAAAAQNGANAAFSGLSGGAADAQMTAYAQAYGLLIDTPQIGGTVSNTGAVTVRAGAGLDVHIAATATGAGHALARIFAQSHVVLTAEASAYGLAFTGESDGVDNSGALTVDAVASLDLKISAAAATSSVQAAVTGAQGVWIRGAAGAYGLVTSLTGTPSLTNSGAITARAAAHVEIDMSAETPNGAGAVIGSNSGTVAMLASAYAHGIDARFDDLSDGFTNSGEIVGAASAALHITFDAADTARVAASDSSANAVATAYGIMLLGTTIGDHLTNTGDVFAHAFASAYAFGLRTSIDADAIAVATALYVGQSGTIDGDLVNGAALVARAEARIGGTSTGTGRAEAVGLELRMNVAGDLINAGTIAGSAYGTMAAAYGIRIVDHVVAGSIKNTGVVAAFVNGSADTRPVAIDAGQASGATTVEQLDGFIVGDVNFSNALADTLEFSGGEIVGDLFGNGGDHVLAYAGVDDVLSFSGLIDNFATIDVNFPSATAWTPPVELRIGGEISNSGLLSVNPQGTLVVGSAAAIGVATYRQDPLGTTAFEIRPGAAGRITAGTADLAGMLEVRAAPGLYADHESFLIVDGGVASGDTYDSLSYNGFLLQVRDDYSMPGDVYLDVSRIPFDAIGGLTKNQNAVGGALEDDYGDIVPGTDFADVVGSLFGLSEAQYREALDDLAGAEHAQMLKVGAGAIQSIDNALMGRLAFVRGLNAQQMASVDGVGMAFAQVASTGDVDFRMDLAQAEAQAIAAPGSSGIWARVFGGTSALDGDDEAPGFDTTGGGVTVGIDHRIAPDVIVGLYGGYAHTAADFDTSADGSVDTWQVGAYGSWASGALHVDGLITGAWQAYELTRSVDFLGRTASSDYDGWAIAASAQVGYDIALGSAALLEPMVGLDYIHLETDGFEEDGADSVDLNVESGAFDSLRSSLGLRLTAQIDAGDGMVLVPTASIAWEHEFLEANGEFTASFAGAPNGTTFDIVGSDDGADAAVISLGLALSSEIMTAFVGYDGRVSGDASAHQGTIGIRFGF